MNTKFYLGQILLAIIHDDPACGCYLLLPVQPFQLSPKDFIFTCQNPIDGARLREVSPGVIQPA